MRIHYLIPLALVVVTAGCMGLSGIDREPSRDAGSAAFGKNADRCTRCHASWSREFGYYRGWDRHGLISDYMGRPPAGYKDPWGLDAPSNPYRTYYYTDWWREFSGEERINPYPEMNLDEYGVVNEGKSKPKNFSGKVIIVDPSGKGTARTIQEGVNRARAGSTVFVQPGTYRESVRLKRGIRLWGANPKTTIINSGTTQSGIIAANGCDISGFTITGTGMDYDRLVFTAGIHALDCDSTLVIRGNIFYSNAVYGVLIESSRSGGTPKNPSDRYILPEKSLRPLRYRGYPNPRIIGNTFHMIGERAVYCIHASPEIANNIFMGNVKTVGMTQSSRPFIHHNVFYRNNVSLNINRSRPVVAYNIMCRNHWGQRVVEGSAPVVHHNVTWESPWFREFGEDGNPITYEPFPGTDERAVNPGFSNPDKGDFRITSASAVKALSSTRGGFGLVRGYGVQYPPSVPCTESWGEDFLSRNDTTRAVVDEIDRQNARIQSLGLSYSVEYRSYLKVKYNRSGNRVSETVTAAPVSGTEYRASVRISPGQRRKSYRMRMFAGRKSAVDSGMVFFDGGRVRVPSGMFKTDSRLIGDARHIGEWPVRENIGGILLDYDQYLNGAIGPGGTFYYGYLRILGGLAVPGKETVDGAECIVIRYPHLGSDQYYRFFLDPRTGYRPRRLEQYFERRLYRKIDGYRYETAGGVPLPVSVTVTDYVVSGPDAGKVAGVCTMTVTPGSIVLNGARR